MSTPSMPAAWYPDPLTPGLLRWWDGTRWTEHVNQPYYPVLNAGPTGTRYAGFWERFLALFVDGLIVGIPVGIVEFAAGRHRFADFLSSAGNGDPHPFDSSGLRSFILLWGLVGALVSAAYFIGLVGKYGRTLGQRVVSIRVVTAAGAVPPGYGVSAKRWLIPGGLGLLAVIPLVGSLAELVVFVDYLSMLWSDQKQCWHDKFARTWVVHEYDKPH